jgi:hypothetical protein
MDTLKGYAVCKDCGNGTMNNQVHTVFELDGDVAVCQCGSTHIDGELYLELSEVA